MIDLDLCSCFGNGWFHFKNLWFHSLSWMISNVLVMFYNIRWFPSIGNRWFHVNNWLYKPGLMFHWFNSWLLWFNSWLLLWFKGQLCLFWGQFFYYLHKTANLSCWGSFWHVRISVFKSWVGISVILLKKALLDSRWGISCSMRGCCYGTRFGIPG